MKVFLQVLSNIQNPTQTHRQHENAKWVSTSQVLAI